MVTSTSDDRTWQLHLEAILPSRRGQLTENTAIASTASATQLLRSICLGLRNLTLEMESLFARETRPRKIDVRKLYAVLLRLVRNLKLASHAVERPYSALSQCLELTASIWQVRAASFLRGKSEAQYLETHPTMATNMQTAIDHLCLVATTALSADYPLPGGTPTESDVHPFLPRTMLTTWMLACVLLSPLTPTAQLASASSSLTRLGQQAYLPQAAGLASITLLGIVIADALTANAGLRFGGGRWVSSIRCSLRPACSHVCRCLISSTAESKALQYWTNTS